MWDYRHVGFIYFVMYFNKFYLSMSSACNVDSNGFHRFGPNCEHLCHCVGNQRCDDVTGECDECEVPWFGPACQYYDIAFDFFDTDNKRAYGSRHLDNNFPPKYPDLAQDGDYSTCCSTNIASAGSHRHINPFWSIYFVNTTRFYDFQLLLSDNETLRADFNGYKIYIENLTSWGYEDKERNYIPPNTSRSLCYQHDGSKITNRTMVVQCVKTLIGNSVRIEMVNRYTQLVLCDIKISAGRNIAFGKRLTLSPNSIRSTFSSTGAVDGNTDNTHIHNCSGMHGNDITPKWIQVDLMQHVDLNLIVITGYQTDGFLDSGFKIEVSNNSTSLFEEVFDNSTDFRPMAGIFLTSQGQYFKIRQMAAKRHFAVCEIQIFGFCPENYCGYNCSVPCHCRIPGSMKDRLTGVCTSGCAGRWTGRNGLCNHDCSKTTWGEECKYQCGHCNNGDSCNVSNGHCKACAAGYKPTPKCDDECVDGIYGLYCNKTCSSKCKGTCGKSLGVCPDCFAGFTGDYCDKECVNGTFGPGCRWKCHCFAGEPCDKQSGLCDYGCDPGWFGKSCDRECPGGTYGRMCYNSCSHKCKRGCNKVDGACNGCADGWKGHLCDEKNFTASEITGVAGGSVGVCLFLLGLIFASVLVYRRYKSASKKRDTTNVVQDIEYANAGRASEVPYEMTDKNSDAHMYQALQN
ncbi:uncharacterized protein LOC128227287 [Mya arenaria]|uniref:uncharacterized protein LOC128227287 n=2 Tax=Mya arenaria TaxID=6604 RepID=UPI0022E1C56D|nr:uncharacterized protein LOC128227287 [Mya arenaria]